MISDYLSQSLFLSISPSLPHILPQSPSPLVSSSLSLKKPGVIIIEGHVQGLANTRMLGKAGVPVIVVDKDNCIARYSKYCRKYFKCPDYQSDEFITFLIDLHQKESLQDWLLLPSNDHAVYNIAKNKGKLSQHFKIITEDYEVIEKIYNKRKLLTLAQQIGVPIPETVMPVKENPLTVDLRYPVLIKGNNGLTFCRTYKSKAFGINNQQELQAIFNETLKEVKPEEYFIQEELESVNKTVSVTVFSIKGKICTYWMGIKLREHPIKFGTATCCQSVNIPELLEPTEKLMNALNYTGVCEVEWLKDSQDNSFKLIEINARTWLWVGLAEKCGINYPLMIYDYIFEGKVPNHNGYKLSAIWLNIYTDLAYSLKRWVAGMENLTAILKTYKKFYEACWDKRDIKPFIKYGMLIPQFMKKR